MSAPTSDILRIHEKSKKYRYRNLISQVFEGNLLFAYVGDICDYEKAILLQTNNRFQIKWAEPNDPAL
jgi:hypothetical protein